MSNSTETIRLELELPDAVHAALTNQADLRGMLTAEYAIAALARAVHNDPPPPTVDAQVGTHALQLTARETQVLRLLSEGRTRKEAARVLGIEPDTVGYYTKSIYRKFAVTSCTAAVAIAARRGLL